MDRVAFRIFGIPIMWYGVIIAFAMMIAIKLFSMRAKKEGYTEEEITDWALWTIPLAVIGARIYYVIFEWESYRGDFFKIINIRGGGLAIHGGIIAGVIVSIIYCKVKKINFWDWADLIAPSLVIAQGIGRWGNFVNQEAYGGPTSLPWGIMIDGEKVHPTFLYESIGDILIGLFLLYFAKRKKVSGDVFLLYIFLYSLLRFFVESFRTDSLYIGPIRTAQLVSVIGIGFAIIFYIKHHKISPN